MPTKPAVRNGQPGLARGPHPFGMARQGRQAGQAGPASDAKRLRPRPGQARPGQPRRSGSRQQGSRPQPEERRRIDRSVDPTKGLLQLTAPAGLAAATRPTCTLRPALRSCHHAAAAVHRVNELSRGEIRGGSVTCSPPSPGSSLATEGVGRQPRCSCARRAECVAYARLGGRSEPAC